MKTSNPNHSIELNKMTLKELIELPLLNRDFYNYTSLFNVIKGQKIPKNCGPALNSFVLQPRQNRCLWGITWKNLLMERKCVDSIFSAAKKANTTLNLIKNKKKKFCMIGKLKRKLINLFFLTSVEEKLLNVTEWLLQNKANVHTQNNYALIYATNFKDFPMVELLLKKGANIHAKNNEALMFAVDDKNIPMVELLLKNGAIIHGENFNEDPWTLAIMNNDVSMVEFLLDKGANIHARNDTALKIAAIDNEDIPMVKFLLKTAKEKGPQYEIVILTEILEFCSNSEIRELLNEYINDRSKSRNEV